MPRLLAATALRPATSTGRSGCANTDRQGRVKDAVSRSRTPFANRPCPMERAIVLSVGYWARP